MKKVMIYFYDALSEVGIQSLGGYNFDPTSAGLIIERYKKLMSIDKYNLRPRLINKFSALNVGHMDEIYTMPLDYLEHMVDQLSAAQADGSFDLESSEGIVKLKAIIAPYLE